MSEIEKNIEEIVETDDESKNQNERFEIPMDDAIKEFKYHLNSHPRTMLSAKFGDGKTFFLSKFEETTKKDTLIITLHPVNYQVVENKDIFELIKRDILFQITINGMLDENLDISDEAAWAFFIQNNFMGFSESVISYLSLLQSPPETVSKVLMALKVGEIYKKLRNKVMEIKKKYKSTDALEVFMNKCDNISVLEEDFVTKIIQDSIDNYKKENQEKRVVLVIEDMDRLDPAHLFRILNVFSSHLDTNEKYFVRSNGTYFYNKFHFDNVVFVMDFANTEKIFKHFYGNDTDFKGYIEKFITRKVFSYSIKVEKYKYLIKRVTAITCLPEEYVKAVLQPQCFEGKTLRSIVNSFENVDEQFIMVPIYEGKRVHFGILRLYAIMKNLGVDGNELVKCYRSVLEDGVDVMPYIVGVLNMAWRLPSQIASKIGSNHILCVNIGEKKRNSRSLSLYDIEIKGYKVDNNCLDYDLIETTIGEFVQSKKDQNVTEQDKRTLILFLRKFDFEKLPMVLDRFVA